MQLAKLQDNRIGTQQQHPSLQVSYTTCYVFVFSILQWQWIYKASLLMMT